MLEITQPQIEQTLKELGVRPGDGLLVHSALQFLGKPVGGIGIYLDAIQTIIWDGGTLAVPTFNFAFAKGDDFDPAITPSVNMGAFSEYVRTQPGALRSTHPMQSLALLGGHTAELAALDTPSAFDDGSAFDRMLKLDFKLLLLGADIQAASILHYSEQRADVPYRYWKDFTGRILRDGEWQQRTYRMFVRDMDIDAKLEIYAIQHELETRGVWHTVKLNYGQVSLCTLRDFVSAADTLLAQDPWCFVTNRPS